jgi:capsular exopolysaccharide synthesis family protein
MNESQSSRFTPEAPESEKSIDVRVYIGRILSIWPFILAGLVVGLVVAFVVLRYSSNVYETKGVLYIESSSKSQLSADLTSFFSNAGLSAPKTELENQKVVLESQTHALRTIKRWPRRVLYRSVGRVRTSSQLADAPVRVQLDTNHVQFVGWNAQLVLSGKSQVEVEVQNSGVPFLYATGKYAKREELADQTEGLQSGTYALNRWYEGAGYRVRFVSGGIVPERNAKVVAEIIDPIEAAEQLLKNLTIEPYSKEATAFNITYKGQTPELNEELLDTYMEEYLRYTLELQNNTSNRTLEFIGNELGRMQDSLQDAEGIRERFRSANKIFDISSEGQRVLAELTQDQKDLARLQSEMKYLDYLMDRLRTKQAGDMATATMGITNAALNNMIQEYTTLQVQRAEMGDLTGGNPALQKVEAQLAYLTKQLVQAVNEERNRIKIGLEEITERNQNSEGKLAQLPKTERDYISLERKFQLNQEIYTFLRQKQAEVSITKSSNLPTARIIDKATTNPIPVSPKTALVYVLGAVLGLGLPIGVLFVLLALDDRIHGRPDIEMSVNLPVIATLGHNKSSTPLVALSSPRSSLTEAFRALRVATQFFQKKVDHTPIYMVTSTFTGEGKSFVATNLASILSMAGKKTLLVGLDMRRPALYGDFGLPNLRGSSTVLSDQDTLDDAIQHTDYPNLDLLPGGPVPPNPSELLVGERFERFIEDLRSRYDAVVIDTPPVGLIADAMEIMKFSDINLYIVRQEYTTKGALGSLADAVNKGQVQHMGIVLNDAQIKRGYGYGYGGYGYGYGYGYGHETP